MNKKGNGFNVSIGRRAVLAGLGGSMLVPLGRAFAQGQDYPNRPIRFVVPYAPGGGLDILARLLAERMSASFGQQVFVENKAGAATRIGTDFVAKQPADGYTILMSSITLPTMPALFKSLPFDPVADFQPISLIAGNPFLLAVPADSPAKSAREFVEMARGKPGAFTYGVAGVGSIDHLAGALFATMAGIQLTSVPYRGTGEVMPAVVAGQVNATFSSITPLLPHIRSGKVRALGVLSSKRTQLLPDLPTLAEAIPVPGYDIYPWLGVLAPAGMPKQLVTRLNSEMTKIVHDPKFVEEHLKKLGFEAVGSTPDQMAATIKSDIAKFQKVVAEAKITVE